jgi:hypothetical protein
MNLLESMYLGAAETQLFLLNACPADTGNAQIRRVNWHSDSSSEEYRARFTSRPPVFTKRCCKLVRDQFSIQRGGLASLLPELHGTPRAANLSQEGQVSVQIDAMDPVRSALLTLSEPG